MSSAQIIGKAVGVLAVLCGLCSEVVGQGFIGQQVTVAHYVPTDTSLFDGPYQVTVTTNSSDQVLVSPFADHSKGYGVTVLEDSVVINFIATVVFTAGPAYHGVIITNLVSCGIPSITETAPHRIFSYDGNILKMDWQGITVPNGATYTITFTNAPFPGFTIAQQSGAVVLRWSSAVPNAVLEATGSLSSPDWATVTNTPVSIGCYYVVTNATTSQQKFYRLRWH